MKQSELQYLNNLRDKARSEGIPTLLPVSCDYLQNLCEKHKPKNILEIGAAVGYSSSMMLLSSSEDAKIVTMEIDEESYLRAKKTYSELGIENRVTIYLGDACEIVPNMSGNFDLIFLDGPKSHYYEFYPFLKRMLNDGGMLVADNVLFRDKITKEGKPQHYIRTIVVNMRKFLDVMKNDSDFNTQVLDIGDGLLVATKEKK